MEDIETINIANESAHRGESQIQMLGLNRRKKIVKYAP